MSLQNYLALHICLVTLPTKCSLAPSSKTPLPQSTRLLVSQDLSPPCSSEAHRSPVSIRQNYTYQRYHWCLWTKFVTAQAARNLFEKRSDIYSSRSRLIMGYVIKIVWCVTGPSNDMYSGEMPSGGLCGLMLYRPAEHCWLIRMYTLALPAEIAHHVDSPQLPLPAHHEENSGRDQLRHWWKPSWSILSSCITMFS